jgi:hypothetical protein
MAGSERGALMDRYDDPRRNPEHYPDPTAADAIAAVAKEEDKPRLRGRKRPLVYICSPYRGNVAYNVRRAQSYCRFAISRNAVPFAPHLHYTQFLDDNVNRERKIGISCGVAMLSRCDQIWVFGDKISAGMKAEIQAAERFGIPVRRFNSMCKEIQAA